MMSISKNYKETLIKLLLLTFFLGMFLLARTYMGIYILGFRIGEYAILISFVFLFLSLAQYKYKIISNSISKSSFILLVLLVTSFPIFVLLSNGNFANMYTYKSSSYIWSFGFLFIGIRSAKFVNFTKEIYYLFCFSLIYIYLFSIYGFPDNLQNLFLKVGDKFEYHKGSDILIMFLSIFFIANRSNTLKNSKLDVFIFFSALFGPLLLYKSRGAFIAFSLYLILEVVFLKSEFKRPLKKNLILLIVSTVILLQSLFIVNKNGPIVIEDISVNITSLVEFRKVPVSPKEINNDFLYFEEGRIFSGDGNLNWRLQIWQDVVRDLINEKKLFIGFGYNEKFSAMDDPFRSGNDGTNENVHNFLINVLGRGGLIHLALYLSTYYLIAKKLISINNIFILNYLIPIIFTSLFDASMENSHFSLLFYFILGVMFNKRNKELVN